MRLSIKENLPYFVAVVVAADVVELPTSLVVYYVDIAMYAIH